MTVGVAGGGFGLPGVEVITAGAALINDQLPGSQGNWSSSTDHPRPPQCSPATVDPTDPEQRCDGRAVPAGVPHPSREADEPDATR
ncbi:hypothetical protein [Streptomyces griseorubiginosus]|uniref:hypothetical protein n=1 Tax=Streptomyces griseorubiginosus TaxID=67304 RepID=UPI0036EA43F7